MHKQPNSRMCFVCGIENPIGLKLSFYENEQGQVIAPFTPREEHQGYPGVMHGGLTTALLDEVIGRVAMSRDLWMVTARMEVKFRHPVPIGRPLTVVGEMTRLRGRVMQAQGEIRLEDGTVAAEATATYVRLLDEEAERMKGLVDFWEVVPD
jgi:uncharacterized protein (TIGR00369 family)